MSRRFGQTWWSRRWIEALEELGAAWVTRLPRGRTYARQGRVTLQHVGAGRATAAVQGSRVRPYVVELRLPTFDTDTWRAVVAALAARLRHAAALLEGTMPEDVDEVLADCGVSLFPGPGELRTRCTCPDVANPCKHVAAVHYVLAEAFDDDPFLLPTLRGKDRDALLADLRAARAGASRRDAPGPDAPTTRGVDWRQVAASELVVARGALDEIRPRPRPPRDAAALVRGLGAPPGGHVDLGLDLQVAVADAAARAWARLVSHDPEPAGDGGT